MFGEDAYYKAYDRRCDKIQFDAEKYKEQMMDPEKALKVDNKPTEEALNNLVDDLQKQ